MSPNKVGNVLNWASDLDEGTIEQAERAAKLPFIQGHVALMPDAHFGFGSTVGSVIPTKGAIIPAAIGVDIGCGMIAAQMPLTSVDLPDHCDHLLDLITRAIPAGVGQGHREQRLEAMDRVNETTLMPEMTNNQVKKAGEQMGTLGSGNHFVEVCLDEGDNVWLVLHSGSRGIGNELAKVHIEGAKKLMKQYFIELDDPDLAYLVEGTREFNEYIAAMLWAQAYAYENRHMMIIAAIASLNTFLKRDDIAPIDVINCHHNFTERENHMGQNVWLTRKGAIRAREGDRGVIPGSMGASSYIVRGLGNSASYNSCSHGAGRRMSRGRARKELDVETLMTAMKDKTWNANKAKDLIDEDPRAYKDIDQVMEDQKDLVEVTHKLHQILNYKGM